MAATRLAELAAAVNRARTTGRGRPLVLRCHPEVRAALSGASPQAVPPLPLERGHGAEYMQVALDDDTGLPAGAWQLLEAGEVIAAGVLGVTSWEGAGADGTTVRVVDTGEGP